MKKMFLSILITFSFNSAAFEGEFDFQDFLKSVHSLRESAIGINEINNLKCSYEIIINSGYVLKINFENTQPINSHDGLSNFSLGKHYQVFDKNVFWYQSVNGAYSTIQRLWRSGERSVKVHYELVPDGEDAILTLREFYDNKVVAECKF